MDVILLDIPDIKGQTTIKGFEDKIEVLSASHGVAMQVTASPSSSERTSGRPNHQDLTISKYVDLSTCPLIAACNAGTTLKTVTLTVGRNDAGAVLPYLVYTLGKLEILKLREDYRAMKGDKFTLQEFHDAFLQQGYPPVKLVRKALLGNDSPVL